MFWGICSCIILHFFSFFLGELLEQVSIIQSPNLLVGNSRYMMIIFLQYVLFIQLYFSRKLVHQASGVWLLVFELHFLVYHFILPFRLNGSDKWRIIFSVYQPNTEFKKSCPGKPYTHLCVCR